MNNNLVEVICILDASGSMSPFASDTRGGFNSFINSQKENTGETRVTLVTFNNNINTVYEQKNVQEIQSLTSAEYRPTGYTALLDAVGITISSVGKRLSETPEEQRPHKVIVMISTDGQENSSKEYTRNQIKAMIEEQTNKYSWQFLFTGANIDAVAEAKSLGIDEKFASNYSYNSDGIKSVYRSLSAVTNMSKRSDKVSLDELEASFKNNIE